MASSSLLLFALSALSPFIARRHTLAAAEISIPQISYVIEPFEGIDSRWSFSSEAANDLNTTTSDDALFGDGCLAIHTQGGADFGWIQAEKTYNCHGADYLSLWYKLEVAQQEDASTPTTTLQLFLYEDLETMGERENATDFEDFVEYLVFSLDLSTEEGWQEVTIPLQDRESSLSSLQLHRIRAWRLQVLGQDDASTTMSNTTLLVDHLACYGNGTMMGNGFYTDDQTTLQDLFEQGVWSEQYFQSEISANRTQVSLQDGILSANYTVQQVESWGGFIALETIAPGPSYYNLSQATDIAFSYNVTEAASAPGTTHLRLILVESSECVVECTINVLEHEVWYAFNYILDEKGTGQVKLPLIGSEGPETPFWLTGWAGQIGDRQFDPSYIKGYTLEFSIGNTDEIYSMTQGNVDLFGLQAIHVTSDDSTEDATCRLETEIRLNTAGLVQHEYFAAQCCELCQDDPECLYAVVAGFHCYTASELSLEDVRGIPNSEGDRTRVKAYWMDDAARRGDFCELCDCQPSSRTIDCQNANLRILPKAFQESWQPRVLDLRNNPHLVLMGGGALDEIGQSLEEIWLPKEMVNVAKESLSGLKKLKTIHKEGGGSPIQNAIAHYADAFGDVCCTPGESLEFSEESSGIAGLTFCNMSIYRPGIDTTYVPFGRYYEAAIQKELTPTAPFLSEASESAEKCAEACAISAGCNYYYYDARLHEVEHTCYLLLNKGDGLGTECCNPIHFADEEMTQPGLVAGLPPRTRHIDDNARVMIRQGETLRLQASNAFQAQYSVSLGSQPTRGAVWILPAVLTTTDYKIEISPTKAVLYDENATATITVRVFSPNASSSFVIQNAIQSCDVAFTAQATAEDSIFVDVVVPASILESNSGLSNTAIVLITMGILLVVLVALGLHALNGWKQRKNDHVWMVRCKELRFGDPPEILGRGTFGLVLAADYRGTKVAVKRVIPKRTRKVDRSKRSGGSYIHDGYAHIFDEGQSSGVVALDVGSNGGMDSHQFSLTSALEEGEAHTSGAKRTRSETALWKKMRREFVREMRYLSKLRHPCVTTVMGAVIEDCPEPMLVMELMDHGSLYDLLHNDTVVIEGELVLPILRDVSQGMKFLHLSNPQVVHGDLKSANVLVDKKFRAKIADFGLSQKKFVKASGTPYWMAPELLRGAATNTPATDVYSFGMVLYEVYSRRDPYEGEAFDEVIRQIADRQTNKRPPVPENMPDTVKAIMMDCLQEDPGSRSTFRKLDQLLNHTNAQSVEPTQPTPKEEMTTQRCGRNLLFREALSLRDLFPEHVALALKEGRKTEPERHEMVTIFFSKIVSFTKMSETLEPNKVADLLDRLYNAFDVLADKYGAYKVETIGDSFMCATNLVKPQASDHVARIAMFAVEAIVTATQIQIDKEDPSKGFLQIRAGFHSGPCVSDVVGTKNPVYTLFGDAVNLASRMESTGEVNRIQCSRTSAELLGTQSPQIPLTPRGLISVKGKGELHTFWVNEEPR